MASKINWPLKSWFCSTRLIFSHLYHVFMDLQKISKSLNLAFLRVLLSQKQCSKFQNFGVSTKKFIETQKCIQAAWPPLFCQFLTYHANFEVPQLLTELSVCAEIFRIILSHMYLSSGKVSSDSEIGHVPNFEILVNLTWNDPCLSSRPACFLSDTHQL